MLQDVLREIRAMRDRPFEQIEHFVESHGQLTDDEKAIAWLYGWLGGEPRIVAAELGRAAVAEVGA